jgi:hypothetical protein
MAELFADLPGALANSGRNRTPLQPGAGTGQAQAAELSDAGRHDDRRLPGCRSQRGLEAPAASVPRSEAVREQKRAALSKSA